MKDQESTSTDTDDLEAMPSGTQPVLAEYLLVGELTTSIPILVHLVLADGLEALDGMSVGKESRNYELTE